MPTYFDQIIIYYEQVINYIINNAGNIIQSLGVILTLLFTAVQIRTANKINKFNTVMAIAQAHKELWSKTLDNTDLARFNLPDDKIDITSTPVNEAEEMFAILIISHMNMVYHANRMGIFPLSDAQTSGMVELINSPIVKKVWTDIIPYQEIGYVKFMSRLERRQKFILRVNNLKTSVNRRITRLAQPLRKFVLDNTTARKYKTRKLSNTSTEKQE